MTDLQRATQIGKWRYGCVERTYLCGECRARQIAPEQGLCTQCKVMLASRALHLQESQQLRRRLVVIGVLAVGALVAGLVIAGRV